MESYYKEIIKNLIKILNITLDILEQDNEHLGVKDKYHSHILKAKRTIKKIEKMIK